MKKTVVILLCFILASCSKSSLKEPIESISAEKILLNYLAINRSAKNNLVVSSSYIYNSKSHGYQVDATFTNEQRYDHLKLNDVRLEKFEVPGVYQSHRYMADHVDKAKLARLFGKTVQLSFEGGMPKNGEVGAFTTYDEMLVTIPTGTNNTPATSGSVIPRNVPLHWTPNSNNGEVYIIISFDPNSIFNPNFAGSQPIERHYVVPDNGSHTISADKFDGIPNGANVEILVARGRTALIVGLSNSNETAFSNISRATIFVSPRGGDTGCPNGCLHIN